MRIRTATATDIERVTETVALAFARDPVWSVALAREDGSVAHHEAYWRFFVASAQAQGSVRLVDDGAAVAVWIPPGGEEVDAATMVEVLAFNRRELGLDRAMQLEDLLDRFDANHQPTERHAYLSLLATHPDHRGKGIGQQLLAATLNGWDEAGVPSWLESTNPANDHRYERLGFRAAGGFRAVRDDAPITTMWRAVAGG
jgi:GNAT superfamily N-acetyltransferase